jgi:PPM family protein phosphatase
MPSVLRLPDQERHPGPPSLHAMLAAGAVVCGVYDGCGGSKAGELPSQVVARIVDETLPLAWSSMSSTDLGSQLVLAVRTAGQRLFNQHVGMGTTATLVAALDNHLHLAHVADSRAYLFRDSSLMQLSRDHTLVAALLENGQLKPEDVASFPHRRVILRALGTLEHVAVDAHSLDVQPGDKVLLCSDGVSSMIDDAQLAAILCTTINPEMGCSALIEAAEQAGGHDNETVVPLAVEASG